MNACSYKLFDSCSCTDTCRSETAHLRLVEINAKHAAEQRAYNRRLSRLIEFTLLCGILAGVMFVGAVNQERQEKINQEIAQGDHHG